MILNTTVPNDEIIQTIKSSIGSSFSLWERIKMKGIGSKRMIIENTHSSMAQYLNADHYLTFCNIELRPKGILIHITKRHQVFSWVIPYYKLVIFKSEMYTLYADNWFIQFRNAQKENKSFFTKIIRLKSEHLRQASPPN